MTATLVLTRTDVSRLLSLSECIDAVETVFRAEAEGGVPAPGILGFHVADGGFHIKAAAYGPYFVTKINANFPGNPARWGLPTIQGVVALYDVTRGSPVALMDSSELIALRTAAASAVAARHLARKDANTAAIVGCGVQGRCQLEAIHIVRPLQRVSAVDADPEKRDRFGRDMSARLGIPVEGADLRTALGSADLLVTCTTSRQAYVSASMIRPGTFIAAVGADHPEKQEIDPGLLASSTLVVDNLDQCLSIGDLHHAVSAGVMTAEQVHGTLGQIIAGLRPGRRSTQETIIFDSTGTALQDVAAAALIYERALRDGVGVPVSLGS